MKAVKRVLVIDPDTGERSVRLEFDTTQPWDEATVALFSQWFHEKGVDARLRHARELLAEIADTPEHDRAEDVLDRGQAVQPNHPAAEAAWMEFVALYEHAKRRIAGRKVRATTTEAAKAKAAKQAKKLRARNKKIVAKAILLLATSTEKHELAGKLARLHKLSTRQIRTILKNAEVC